MNAHGGGGLNIMYDSTIVGKERVGTHAERRRRDARVPGERGLAVCPIPEHDEDHDSEELGRWLLDVLPSKDGALVSLYCDSGGVRRIWTDRIRDQILGLFESCNWALWTARFVWVSIVLVERGEHG